MTETSVWGYLFIRISVAFLQSIAPFSIFYVLNILVTRPLFRLPDLLTIWCTLEAVFYLFFFLPYRAYLQRPANHPTLPDREYRRKLFRRCHQNVPDPERYLQKWFRDAPATEIKRGNVKDFLRWAFLNMKHHDPDFEEELEDYIAEMEVFLGRKLELGHGKASCLRLTYDRVDMWHRSLTWYLCVFVVDTIAFCYLYYHGFDFYQGSLILSVFPLRPLTLLSPHRSPAKTLTYWHRPHTAKGRLPVFFIHGIGIGLYPYINFLADLKARDSESDGGQVGIIAVEIMPVSSRITHESLSREAMCNEVECILKAHGWEKSVLVSHSYGSVVAAHLLRTPRLSDKIGPVVFIDPISILLHLPDVAYNFTYRKPKRAKEHTISYFGSKDIGISHTLSRRFFWAHNILWKEDLEKHQATVVLAGRDLIANTHAIAAYLTGKDSWAPEIGPHGDGEWKSDMLDVLWFGQLDHGQAFGGEKERARLVDIVERHCAEGTAHREQGTGVMLGTYGGVSGDMCW